MIRLCLLFVFMVSSVLISCGNEGLDHSLRLSSVALEDVIPAKAGIQCVGDP